MKALLFSIILFLFFIFTAPAGAGDGDYKKMISEFENFRSGYQPGLLKTEPGPTGLPSSNSIIDAQLNQLQKRWDQLVGRIFEKESFFYYEDGDQVEMEALRTNPDKATDYLKVHPDISSFLKIVFIRNLHLQSVKKKLEAKLESYSQVVQLEDVLSQISSFVKELDTRAGPMRHKKSIQESYPFPGALSLKASIAEQEVRIAKAKYEIVLKDTVTRIKEAIFEWAYLNEALGITEEHLQLLQELEAVASVHFRTGKGGFNDVIKAQIKISKLRDDLINLREKRGVTEAKIVWFINIGSPFVLDFLPAPPLVPVTLSISDLSDVAFRHQQELKLLLEEIKKSQMAIELAEKKYYPDLSPGFSYFENRENPQLGQVKTDQNFKTDPDTRPKYWFGENDAYIREARLNHQSLLKELEDHKEELRFQVKEFFYQLDKAERAVGLYEKSLLPLAQKALQVSIAEYKTGKTDFLSLLDAETTLLNFGIDYQRALRNHGQNRARLEKLIGKRLPPLEVKNESTK